MILINNWKIYWNVNFEILKVELISSNTYFKKNFYLKGNN
jgi:hypothetical protein